MPADDATRRNRSLGREEALDIAERRISEKEVDLREYRIRMDGEELSEDGNKWLFLFECREWRPGCHFLVTVDRRSAQAEFIPGE